MNGPRAVLQERDVNGRAFRRHFDASHWRAAVKTDDGFDVLCDCGNNTFSLAYGDYSMSATCSRCGHAAEVYSG